MYAIILLSLFNVCVCECVCVRMCVCVCVYVGGILAITPSAGITRETVFFLSALQWIDDVEDLPLKYIYSVVIAGGQTRPISSSQVPYKSTMCELQIRAVLLPWATPDSFFSVFFFLHCFILESVHTAFYSP